MAKFRTRVKGKGKRWTKGHSSSSNPETSKYREAARSRFFHEDVGKQSKLTSDALRKHDAFLGTKPEPVEVDDVEESDAATTLGGRSFRTFQTFASDWSACSNVSFSKFLSRFTSNCALHKEMLAVLAAVTEVIKSSGGTESTTEYFAALMTTLSVSETEDSLGAVLTLLGMGIKSVPQSVLRKKFSESSQTFMDVLGRFAESENQIIVRSVIGCLSVLLRNQEIAVWKNSSTLQVLDSILAFTTHSKPKVRKAAQHAVCALLKSTVSESDPAASHVAKFCVRTLEDSVSSLATQTTLLHTLALAKETIAVFPKQQLKVVCETVLKVMTLSNVLVSSCGMQVLHSLFIARPSVNVLPSTLNAQLISALYDYQPPVTDAQPTLAWLAVMQEAHINLGKQDIALCCAHLPHLFTTVTQMLLCDKNEVLNNATHVLTAVVSECIGSASAPDVVSRFSSTISKVFETLQGCLKYQYHSAWKHVLHVLAVFFEACGVTCEALISPCLQTLGELRDSCQFACVNELDYAVGKAIQAMGPQIVLKAIPLQISGEEVSYQMKRSWLLPVLRESISAAPLAFFIEYFLPLATMCKKKSVQMEAQGKKPEAVSYELLQSQVWALLPSFCNNPTDLKDSFKNIARVLGTAISDRKDLRLSVMGALRKLITRNREGEPTTTKQENLKELARFAKNYLPILFNIYTTKPKGSEEEGHRLAVYETIQVYLSISDASLQTDLFDRAFQKLETGNTDAFVKECVLDLLRALMPYQPPQNILRLYEVIHKGIADEKNARGQKKSYRLLEVLCSSGAENCQKFTNEHWADLQKLLLNSLSTSATSSRGARLRCLIHLVRQLPAGRSNIVKMIVPEAVLCCKDINERCRLAAYALLHELGLAMLRWKEESTGITENAKEGAENGNIAGSMPHEERVMRDFLGLLLAGLAGSPHLTSATLLALADITHHFRTKFPDDLIQLLVDNVCLLTTSPTREVVGSALSFLKQFVYSFPTATVGPYIPSIMKALVGMTDDCKRHFRRVTQHMLDRMIRKYGCDAIERQVPKSEEGMHKRLRNLRKLHARRQRLQEERLANKQEQEDSDDEERFSVKARARSIEEILAESDDEMDMEVSSDKVAKGGKKNKGQTWIQEEPGAIVDLADSMAASHISASKPGTSGVTVCHKAAKRNKDGGFKTAADGRLIIEGGSSDEDDEGGRRIPTLSDSESGTESGGEEETRKAGSAGRGRKRKLSGSTDARSTTSFPAIKYQAGGLGIHRPISKASSIKSGFSSKTTKPDKTDIGAEYRAKKAKGDIKKKGAPDPFAYVPLNRGLLNKRKKLKQAGQFKSVVRAARKGAAAGRVAKRRVTRKQ